MSLIRMTAQLNWAKPKPLCWRTSWERSASAEQAPWNFSTVSFDLPHSRQKKRFKRWSKCFSPARSTRLSLSVSLGLIPWLNWATTSTKDLRQSRTPKREFSFVFEMCLWLRPTAVPLRCQVLEIAVHFFPAFLTVGLHRCIGFFLSGSTKQS